jgi:beta-glucanase (GH16 family)
LLPTDNTFGVWPKSGEIDIMESRGNLPSSCSAGMGADTFGSTMHWGPLYNNNGFNIPNSHYSIPQGTLNDDYHIYELEWTEAKIVTKIDGITVMNFDFPAAGGSADMYSRAGFPYTSDAEA